MGIINVVYDFFYMVIFFYEGIWVLDETKN